LNSKTRRSATGLGNSSGQLGRNLMDHAFGAGADATMPGMEEMTYYGRRPNGVYVPRFRNVKNKHPDFLRGYAFQGGASRDSFDPPLTGIGADFKRELVRGKLGPWRFHLMAFAECLPRESNFVELHPTLVDKWGVPALTVRCAFGPNERALLKDAQLTAAEILNSAGAKDIKTYDRGLPPGLCIHEMGTARMGRDPKTSVLNAHNQLWDVKNVFATDGSCMTSSGNQNPSLTYMALTARAAAYAVECMKRSEI
jgi:choline dehydrogenase-like flavoprotein